MKLLFKISMLLLLLFSSTTTMVYTANDPSNAEMNLQTWNEKPKNSSVDSNSHLQKLENNDKDFTTSTWWIKGIHNTILRIAKDLKNLFFIIAWIYFLIITIRIIFSSKTEEEVWNFKKWILWVSIWIIVTQIAYWFVAVLFDKSIDNTLAKNFIDTIVKPLVALIESMASFVFLAIMIYAFYRLISANWDEEKAKSWKMSVIYAIVWFIVVRISGALVNTIYWETYCYSHVCQNREQKTDLEWFARIIVDIIDWANWFVWIITILLIIYAWFLVLTSVWDEEKLKKAKNIILYIAIWITVLVANYLILTFFIF